MIKQYTQEDIDRLMKKLYDAPTLKLSDDEVKTLVDKYKNMYLEYGHNKDPKAIDSQTTYNFYVFLKNLLNAHWMYYYDYKTWYDLFYDYNLSLYNALYRYNPNEPQNEFDRSLTYKKEINKTENFDGWGGSASLFTYADPRIVPLFKEFLKIVPEAKRNRN